MRKQLEQLAMREAEERLLATWKDEGQAYTFEDYCIFVHTVGWRAYQLYHKAHFRDDDIVTGRDVWNALRNTDKPFQKAVTF